MGTPIDRTAKTALDSNLVNGVTSDAPKVKANNDVLYNYSDTLNGALETHAAATTLPHADQSVTGPKIKDYTLTETKYATGSVSSRAIANGAVGVNQLATGLAATVDVNAQFAKRGLDVTSAPYNADPTGVTDSTAAILAAINAVIANGGGEVIIPNGDFKVTSQILIDLTTWTGNSFVISGNGRLCVPEGNIAALNTSTFTGINDTSTGGLIRIHTADDTTQKVLIHGISFYKPDSTGNIRYGTFINVATWRNVRIEHCSFEGGDTQILIDRTYGCAVVRCNFTVFNQAIWIKSAANTTLIDNNVIRNGRNGILVDSTVLAETTVGVNIINNYIETLSNAGIMFKGVRISTIQNNYFESCDISQTYETGYNVAVYLAVGVSPNTEGSARNLIIGNSCGSSQYLYTVANGGSGSVIIGDGLFIRDKNAIPTSTIVSTDNKITSHTLEEASAGQGISVVGRFVNESVISPTFENSWAKATWIGAEPVGYWRDPFGIVHLEGIIDTGVMLATAFTLPVGYRPRLEMRFAVDSADALGQLRISPTGFVIPRLGSNASFSLSGVTFRAYGF